MAPTTYKHAIDGDLSLADIPLLSQLHVHKHITPARHHPQSGGNKTWV